MNAPDTTHRRGFLGRLIGAAAAAGASLAGGGAAAAQESGPEEWIKEVKGSHRCLFDFPQHRNGMPLLHILNYLNTYSAAFKVGPGQAGAVGTFYGMGPQSSIPFAFNDAMWAKYQLGEYTALKDAAGKPYTRNPFYHPTKDDLHLLMAAIQSPTIPAFADAMPGLGIESLQKMGTKFLLCANAFGGWCLELDARGKGKAPEIQKELTGNLIPGVTIVPAMVIAIEQAQGAGIKYKTVNEATSPIMKETPRMKKVMFAAAAIVLSGPLMAAGQQPSADRLIAEAVQILPDDLRAGATVVTYDASGTRKVLRQGTNFLECQPRMADGFTRCYNKALAPRRDLEAKLHAEKKSDDEIQKAVAAAVKAGTLPPSPKGMMAYRGYDKRDRIQNLWVISLPNATPESVGVSTASQRDAALEGKGLPWMMLPGTPGAHIMIPINPPAKNSTITDQAADEITQATLPLPDDLRAGAAVYKYDPKTGERVVLRKGTNKIECTPRAADGFTWCYNTVTAPRRDFSAKLRAQGKSDKEIQEAVVAATKAGTLLAPPFGTMSYRLYGKKDRIQLLWVLSVPDATPETIGVSDGSQRDEAIGGDGRPWLMLAGTPGAHIMIPINK